MEKPEEYSKEKIEKIVKKYTHKAQVINASRKIIFQIKRLFMF